MLVRTWFALCFVLLFLCNAAGVEARVHPWTTPHVLTISDAANPSTLNPHLSQAAPTANMSEMTMAWLLRWDRQNRPYPELATAVPTSANGGVSKDGLTITYHLRHGVRWSDGAPFTADDVVFSTQVVNNPANDEGGRFDQVARVTAPDPYTVVFHLKSKWSTFAESLFTSCCANPPLLPKHLLGKYRSINNAPYNALPVGIGPFKFERWDRSKQVVMVANPLYWRGRPKLDKVVYKIIPNRDELLAELTAHRVDLWYQFSGAYLDRINTIGGVSVLRRPSYAYDHFDFNITHEKLADVRVRQALRFALDRNAIVDEISHGVGIVADSAEPVSAPYFSDLGVTPYDPAKANELLDAAGWLRAADGIREKQGARLTLTIASSQGQPDTDQKLAMLQKNWRDVGVAVDIHHYPSAEFFAQPNGVIYGDGWDVVYFAWAADPMGDYSGQYACSGFPPHGANVVRWCNPRAQQAMDALLGHYDQSERTADVQTVMREFIADTPSIVASIREDLFAFNNDLSGYDPNTVTPFDNMMNVDI